LKTNYAGSEKPLIKLANKRKEVIVATDTVELSY